MSDLIACLVFMLICVGALFGIVFAGSHYYGKYQCANYATITGKETRWVAFDACYIQAEAGWERWDEYKLRAAASEGLKAMQPQ